MSEKPLSERYPHYYKPLLGLTEADVYAFCWIWGVNDPSGCLHHALKKILVPGNRTGGKSRRKDIKEAADTLLRLVDLMDTLPDKDEVVPDAAEDEVELYARGDFVVCKVRIGSKWGTIEAGQVMIVDQRNDNSVRVTAVRGGLRWFLSNSSIRRATPDEVEDSKTQGGWWSAPRV